MSDSLSQTLELEYLAVLNNALGGELGNLRDAIQLFNSKVDFEAYARQKGLSARDLWLRVILRIHPDKIGRRLENVATDFVASVTERMEKLVSVVQDVPTNDNNEPMNAKKTRQIGYN